jgi:hypothetical protein
VISASSARLASLITGGVAAVSEVFSEASIVILVESIDVHVSFISTVTNVAHVATVVNEALTSVRLNA